MASFFGCGASTNGLMGHTSSRRRWTGTYSPAFVTSGVLCGGAAVFAWSAGRTRRPRSVPVLAEAAPPA